MASFNNSHFLAGNLTRDPELRYTPKGTAIAQITLAVNRTWKSDIRRIQRGKSAASSMSRPGTARGEVIAQYMRKGPPAAGRGPPQTRA